MGLEDIEKDIKKGIENGVKKEAIAKSLFDILDNQTIILKTKLSIDVIQKLRDALIKNINILKLNNLAFENNG